MRLAARSNWLSTMALPDMVVRGVAAAVTRCSFTPVYGQGRAASSLAVQAAAGEAAGRVLRFRQRVGDVDPPRVAPRRIGQDADHVCPGRRAGGGGGVGGGGGGSRGDGGGRGSE